jgi:hypothetical protein
MSTIYLLLTIICQTQAWGNICLFQVSPEWEKNNAYPVVWVSRTVKNNPGARITFTWKPELSLGFGKTTGHSGAKVLMNLTDSVFIQREVNPGDRNKQAAMLSYDAGGYRFSPDEPDAEDRHTVILKTGPDIPSGSNVTLGLCMDGSFICRVLPAPNMTYRIDTQTKYGLVFGPYNEGQRLDIENLKNVLYFSAKDFEAPGGKTVTLRWDNIFSD